MSNSDSFIEEVADEVRRDRLFAVFRRYGWIAILIVVLIVGTAAYFEWRRAQDNAAAQAFGSDLVGALDLEDAAQRIAALEAIETDDAEAGAILGFLISSEMAGIGDEAEAAAQLRAMAETTDIPDRYRDLALLRAQMLDPLEHDAAMPMLDELATPGRPYRALAIEQQALSLLRGGDRETAIALLEQLQVDAEATASLQQRALQLIIALESGAALVDGPSDAPGPVALPTGEPVEDEAPATAPAEDEAAPTAEDGAAPNTVEEPGPDAGDEAGPEAGEDG